MESEIAASRKGSNAVSESLGSMKTQPALDAPAGAARAFARRPGSGQAL